MKLPRWARWLIVVLGVLVLLAGATIFAATRYFDRERITALVAEQVQRATARQIHFDGPIGFSVLPSLALRLEGVRLANASWGTQPDMLKLRRLELVVAVWPLLHKQLQIRRVVLDGVELWLETDAKGHGNWSLPNAAPGSPAKPAESAGAAMNIDLAQAEIRDSTVTLRDGKTGRIETLGLKSVTLSADGATDKLDAQIRLREQALSIKGTSGKIADVLGGAANFPLDLTLALDGGSIAAKGSIGLAANAGKASLDLDADIRQTTALARLVGSALPLPLPLRFTGRLEQSGARSAVPSFKLVAAGQAFTGNAEFDASAARPRVKLAVQAGTVELAALLPPPTKAATTAAKPARLFSDAPLPLTALPALDATVDLVIAKLQLPGKPALSALHAALSMSDGQVVVQPLAFRMGSGSVDGAATLRLRSGAAPSLALRAHSDGITVEELLAMTGAGGGVSGGRTALQLDLNGSGGSMHQLASSLNGEVLFQAEQMRLSSNLGGLGGDLLTKLVETVNPFYKQDKGSNLSCVVARLPLKGGAISVDRSIAAESEKLNVVAAGGIDLGAETLDLSIRPTVKEGLGVGAASLAQLVKLSGSLSDPRIGVNLKGAAREGLSVGAAVATGGLSLLGERMLKERDDPHPCLTALGAKVPAATLPEAKAPKNAFKLPNPLDALKKR